MHATLPLLHGDDGETECEVGSPSTSGITCKRDGHCTCTVRLALLQHHGARESHRHRVAKL